MIVKCDFCKNSINVDDIREIEKYGWKIVKFLIENYDSNEEVTFICCINCYKKRFSQ